jgi:hypothetical protein
MPLLTTTEPREKRLASLWVRPLAVVVLLLLLGLVGWSWVQPVEIPLGHQGLAFGRYRDRQVPQGWVVMGDGSRLFHAAFPIPESILPGSYVILVKR